MLTFNRLTLGHPPLAAKNSGPGQSGPQKSPSRLRIQAEQLQPIPIPIPIHGPRKTPITPTIKRISPPQSNRPQPTETETSTRRSEMSILGAAVFGNRIEEVGTLLEKLPKETVNQPDANGFTPLAVAVRYGNDAMASLLLSSKKTEINQPNQDGRTPLILAARYGRLPLLRQLLNHPQIALNARDKDGYTALDWCLRQHNQAGKKLLQ